MREAMAKVTPFDQGTRAAKIRPAAANPHPEGSVEYRNFELGRQFGLRYVSDGDRFRAAGPAA